MSHNQQSKCYRHYRLS